MKTLWWLPLLCSSAFATSTDAVWGGGFLAIALMLILVEIFILPGLSLSGVVGVAALMVSVYFFFPDNWLLASACIIIGGAVLLYLLFRFFPQLLPSKRLVLTDQAAPPQVDARWLHHSGVANTNLRPAGAALIDGQLVDVVSSGEYIEAGSAIKVVLVDGTRVVVVKTVPSTS